MPTESKMSRIGLTWNLFWLYSGRHELPPNDIPRETGFAPAAILPDCSPVSADGRSHGWAEFLSTGESM
jgi:hypothetical protein